MKVSYKGVDMMVNIRFLEADVSAPIRSLIGKKDFPDFLDSYRSKKIEIITRISLKSLISRKHLAKEAYEALAKAFVSEIIPWAFSYYHITISEDGKEIFSRLPDSTVITIQDSLAARNCFSGTNAFVENYYDGAKTVTVGELKAKYALVSLDRYHVNKVLWYKYLVLHFNDWFEGKTANFHPLLKLKSSVKPVPASKNKNNRERKEALSKAKKKQGIEQKKSEQRKRRQLQKQRREKTA
ncbi:MAG: hypothetical protein ACM3UU_09395 [Ignavibacteriales bacterium]